MMLSRWTPIGLIVLAMAATIGCARWIDVRPSVAEQQEAAAASIADHERVPLLLDVLRVTQNGAPQNPSAAVERRILNQVRETRLFSVLVPLGGNASSPGGKIVTARIAFDQTIDPHSGEAAWKGFIIGASMFLLSPLIELNYDYAAQVGLELERWDGQVKRYLARSVGRARYNLFGASPLVIEELKGQVTEACLTHLMEQLVSDTLFYVAGSAPLPDSSIKTVTVKARRLSPAALSAVPGSLLPNPVPALLTAE